LDAKHEAKELALQMALAKEIMRKDDDVLAALAKL
jgi:hypothetical protein